MNENEIKKDLYKSKEMARFSHYNKGRLFYEVKFLDNVYQFPIDTVEEKEKYFKLEYNNDFVLTDIEIIDENEYQLEQKINVIQLSEDLGETIFSNEIKGSDLIRWITKAIKNEELRKVG